MLFWKVTTHNVYTHRFCEANRHEHVTIILLYCELTFICKHSLKGFFTSINALYTGDSKRSTLSKNEDPDKMLQRKKYIADKPTFLHIQLSWRS